MNENKEEIPPTAVFRGMGVLRTGLLIAGSAMLGGLAVVLWNRTALARLREPHTPTPPADEAEEDEA